MKQEQKVKLRLRRIKELVQISQRNPSILGCSSKYLALKQPCLLYPHYDLVVCGKYQSDYLSKGTCP